MSEESVLILSMLREGKITAEQADSLLRAVRETGASSPPPVAPVPPIPPVPPVPPVGPDSAAMAAMQAKLAELQGKLGDLQGKLGAAQTTRTTDYASALAGKIFDSLPKPDLDMGKINKAVDEAMRGLSSLKNDAVRTAKTAARQASHEARRAGNEVRRSGRDGRRGIKFEFNFDLGSDPPNGRPENSHGEPEATQTSQETVTWTGADKLALQNNYGSITVIGVDTPSGTAEGTLTKTAWAGTESEARIILQQVFLTHQVENGRCKVGIAAPRDADERLTVDYEMRVPRSLALEITTTYGDVIAKGTSESLMVQSASGTVEVSDPWTGEPGETRLHSHTGDISIKNWNAPAGSVFVESSSAGIEAADVTAESISLTSRSGDIEAKAIHAGTLGLLESASGDVSVVQSTAKDRIHLRTQSGQASISESQAEQIQIETVSGDAEIEKTSGALTVKTVSGDVEASEANSPAISLVTVSGDAEWTMSTPFSGAFAGTTVSGDLHLRLPSGSDTHVEMNTTSGTLAIKMPVTDAVTTERHAAGTLGAGTGSIRLQSVSGDLVVSEPK
ncbi:MAG: DUF4097 family beta strand repeat-containing protein [Janthinobacterium lividum]